MEVGEFLKWLEGKGYSYSRIYTFKLGIELIFNTFEGFPSEEELERYLRELYVRDLKRYKYFRKHAYSAFYKYLEYLKHRGKEVKYNMPKQDNDKKGLRIKMADFLKMSPKEFERKYSVSYWDVRMKITKGEFKVV